MLLVVVVAISSNVDLTYSAKKSIRHAVERAKMAPRKRKQLAEKSARETVLGPNTRLAPIFGRT